MFKPAPPQIAVPRARLEGNTRRYTEVLEQLKQHSEERWTVVLGLFAKAVINNLMRRLVQGNLDRLTAGVVGPDGLQAYRIVAGDTPADALRIMLFYNRLWYVPHGAGGTNAVAQRG